MSATMPTLEQKASEAIKKHALLPHREIPVICALSGGADSTALLCVLTALGYKCIAAHCNYHLRGEESNRDARHAEHIATLLNVPLEMKDLDVEAYQRENNSSIEMACRDLRYTWFDQLLKKHNAQAIAVAHNAGDNIETMLLNLFRGTGIMGLTGMKWCNDMHVVRPLLLCTRNEIEDYLSARGINFVTDSTNLQTEFQRNKIRHCIIPEIMRNFPGSLNSIASTMEVLTRQAEMYSYLVEQTMQKYIDDNGGIDLYSLSMHPHAHTLLYEWLKPTGVNPAQIQSILSSISTSGVRFLCKNGTLFNDHGMLRAYSENMPEEDFPFEITVHNISEFTPEKNNNTAYFDASISDTPYALQCRYWEKGDRIEPYGMKGSKKLSDLFNDAKLSIPEKNATPLLVLGDKILWVAGIRASRHYPVTNSTRKFIKVKRVFNTCRKAEQMP